MLLMLYEPTDTPDVRDRVSRAIDSYINHVKESNLDGVLIILDGAFDAAIMGTEIPPSSSHLVTSFIRDKYLYSGIDIQYHSASKYLFAWPNEATKLTHGLRLASYYSDYIIRIDSDEYIPDGSESFSSVIDRMKAERAHAAYLNWVTIGKQHKGNQQSGAKNQIRIFKSDSTLTAGGAYHGSYKVFDNTLKEWVCIRARGEENTRLKPARLTHTRLQLNNTPAERDMQARLAKTRLFVHRYEEALSDR